MRPYPVQRFGSPAAGHLTPAWRHGIIGDAMPCHPPGFAVQGCLVVTTRGVLEAALLPCIYPGARSWHLADFRLRAINVRLDSKSGRQIWLHSGLSVEQGFNGLRGA